MGRWSAQLAPLFLDFAALDDAGLYLDLGAGTGVLARTLLERFQHAKAVAVEPSEPLLSHARELCGDPRLEFQVGGAEAIPFADGHFDASLALLILQELRSAPLAVAEMRRVTRPGGVVASCQWDFKHAMPMVSLFWDAVQEVVPRVVSEPEQGRRVPVGYSDAEALAGLWRAGGLMEIQTAPLSITMHFASFEDFWAPFLSGASPTTSYAPTLAEETRAAVKANLRYKILGNGSDRAFALKAQAWAVRGIVASE